MFKRILVPLDGTPDAEQALLAVKAVDEEFESDVTLLLVSQTSDALLTTLAEVMGSSGSTAAAATSGSAMDELGGAYLSSVRDMHGDESWDWLLRHGNPGDAICDVADELDADLIVMASHERSGLSRILMGSVAEHVLRNSRRPLLVVPISNEDDD